MKNSTTYSIRMLFLNWMVLARNERWKSANHLNTFCPGWIKKRGCCIPRLLHLQTNCVNL